MIAILLGLAAITAAGLLYVAIINVLGRVMPAFGDTDRPPWLVGALWSLVLAVGGATVLTASYALGAWILKAVSP